MRVAYGVDESQDGREESAGPWARGVQIASQRRSSGGGTSGGRFEGGEDGYAHVNLNPNDGCEGA